MCPLNLKHVSSPILCLQKLLKTRAFLPFPSPALAACVHLANVLLRKSYFPNSVCILTYGIMQHSLQVPPLAFIVPFFVYKTFPQLFFFFFSDAESDL